MQMKLIDKNNKINAYSVSFPEVIETPVFWGESSLKQAKKYKAIINPKTGSVFAIVSKDYKLIRHEDAVKQVEGAISKHPDLDNYKVKTEFYNDGGRMRRRYCFHEIAVEIKPGDAVNPELQLFNSYDTTWPFIVILGAYRLVCSNGLVVGKKYLHLRKRHVYDFNQMDLKKQLSTALKRFNLQVRQWEKWSTQRLTPETYDKVLEIMRLGKKTKEEIRDRISHEAEGFTCDGFPVMSLWIFFNVLTWFITYRAVSLNHRIEMEKRLRSAMVYFRVSKP